MKYYYIHGLNSTGERTALKLSKVLETDVERLEWNYFDPCNKNINKMKDILDKEQEEFILIGSSLGGYYTRILSNIYEVPCVLFNPVVDIKKSFKNIENVEFYKSFPINNLIESYINSDVADKTLQRMIVVGLQDVVVNPYDTIKLWEGKCNLIKVNEEHQIKDFKPFKKDILHLSIPLLWEAI